MCDNRGPRFFVNRNVVSGERSCRGASHVVIHAPEFAGKLRTSRGFAQANVSPFFANTVRFQELLQHRGHAAPFRIESQWV